MPAYPVFAGWIRRIRLYSLIQTHLAFEIFSFTSHVPAMIHEKGNAILNGMERRFGKLALPQILRWIASFQVLTWALHRFSPNFLEWLAFDKAAVLSGQFWRIFTWIFFPRFPSMGSPVFEILFVVIALLFMFFISDSIESQWGEFRVNVYTFATIVGLSLASLVIPYMSEIGQIMTGIFFSAVFLAFASLFPNQVIHLFAIIPIKAKWLGIANALILAATILGSGAAMPYLAFVVLVGLLPYFLVFVPTFATEMRQRSESAVRKHRFEHAVGSPDDAFHTCDSCGATDHSHPDRSFRVTADGEEYCEVCRPPVHSSAES